MLRKLGIFFIMIGSVMALIYWLTTYFPQPDLLFLVAGILLLGVGILLMRTHPTPPPPERPRFRLLKRKKKQVKD